MRSLLKQKSSRLQLLGSPRESHWSPLEKSQISKQIGRLLKKGAIIKCVPIEDEFISQIFLNPKPDGSSCLILNLKNLNEYIVTEHFKLEDLRTARNLLEQKSFMVTLDLKDMYYVVPIEKSSRKYLRFMFNGLCFSYLSFGLNLVPYIFTKIMRSIVVYLRGQGYILEIWKISY